MGDVRLSKLSSDLADIDEELEGIKREIGQLRRKQHELMNRRQAIEQKIESTTNIPREEIEERWDRDGFPWSDQANQVLKEKFKLSKFRPLQRATINAVMSKEDAIVILSTGSGKSLCYQLPALLSNGLTVVIAPLISLVEDQLWQLKKLGIDASSLNASTSKEEVKRVEDAITNRNSNFRLLYVTPEKLAKSKRIMNKLEKSLELGILKLIAIDEVHCCSQWGHDFRTDYGFLNILKRQFKGVPILGLTATATSDVLHDVKEMLGIQTALVFRAGFNRENLKYEVVPKPTNEEECVNEIAKLIKTRFPKSSGIIYCLSRNDCEKTAKALSDLGIRARHYHAYMEPVDKSYNQELWSSGHFQVIVATVAFGMGIDKPDVRFVIHQCLPKSVENYYQESGRAGRDGQPATCILFYRMADVFRQSSMVQQEKTGLANLYNMVRYASEFTTCRRVRLAEHFEESWDASWCQKQCDVCEKGKIDKEEVDVQEEVKEVIKTISENASSSKDKNGKITGNKLVELLNKKWKDRTKELCEAIVIHMLLNGYLQEDFHYTAYSVISYVGIGSKWRIYDKKSAIMMPKMANAMKASKKRKSVAKESDDEDEDVMPKKNKPTTSKKRKVVEENSYDEDDIVMLD